MQFKKFKTNDKPPKQEIRNLIFLFLFVVFPLIVLFGSFSTISKLIALAQFGAFVTYLTVKKIQN